MQKMSWAWTPIPRLPQNKRLGGKKDRENQDVDGFIKTQNKKWQGKTLGLEINKRVQTQNRYEILQDDKASSKEAQQTKQTKASNKETQQNNQTKDHQEKEMDLNIKK